MTELKYFRVTLTNKVIEHTIKNQRINVKRTCSFPEDAVLIHSEHDMFKPVTHLVFASKLFGVAISPDDYIKNDIEIIEGLPSIVLEYTSMEEKQ